MSGTVAQAKQLHKTYGLTEDDRKNYIEIARIYENKLGEAPKGVGHLLKR